MTIETIKLEQDGDGISWVTFNRPKVHNAFDDEMIARLHEIFTALNADDHCHAVVIRGEGKSFSAGADLGCMKRAGDSSHKQNLADAEKMAWMFEALYQLKKVTIACVTGVVMGGGVGIVSCCDIVIADEKAKFALSEVKIGLIPSTIAPYVLSAMGPRNARRYFQTGEVFLSRRAYDLGLVHDVTTTAEEMEGALKTILDHVRANGPAAMKHAKKLVLDYGDKPIDARMLEDTAERLTAIRETAEAKEGLEAFLEKRNPNWT